MSKRPEYAWMQRFLKKESAIVLEEGKEYLIESRLLSLARTEDYASVWDLVADLSKPKGRRLQGAVVDAMTTNETSFFRDVTPFQLLEQELIPAFMESEDSRPLSILCAACSSGQEPYSIALMLTEKFPTLVNTGRVKIRAWDLSDTMLAEASYGEYSQLAVNRGLPAMMLVKHFEKNGTRWRVKKHIRDLITFEKMNLATRWPSLISHDLVFLRNVLIYFDVATKKQILGEVRRVLRPGGHMFLGAAETTLNLDDAFKRVAFNRGCCYQLPADSRSLACSPRKKLAS